MSISNNKIASVSLIVGLVFGSFGMAPQAVAAPKSTSVVASVSAPSAVSVSTQSASKVSTVSKKKLKKIKANSKKRSKALSVAKDGSRRKVRYVWGGTSRYGWDCSGLVSVAYKSAGVKPKNGRWTTRTLKKDKRFVRTTRPKAGDVVYTSNYHVGIYVGKGKMIDAPNPKVRTRTVVIKKISRNKPIYYTLRS